MTSHVWAEERLIPAASPPAGHSSAGLRALLEHAVEGDARSRVLALLYTFGGLIGLTCVLVGTGAAHPGLIAVCAGTAVVGGLTQAVLPSELSVRLIAPMLALAVVLVGVVVAASGRAATPFELFYAWIGAGSWYLLSVRAAAALTGVVGVASALSLLATSRLDAALVWWLTVMGSVIATGGLAGMLRAHAFLLIRRMADATVRDQLTGLLNRQGFQHRTTAALAGARRDDSSLAVVLVDLDEFKHYNDRFGHRCGDEALCALAEICERHVRDSDFVARVGGEEFALVLHDADERAALLVAERLRRAVSARLLGPDGASLSVSLGVSAFPYHGGRAEVLLDHADQAAQAAKRLGRNRTVRFSRDVALAAPGSHTAEHVQAVLLMAEALDLRDAATAAHSTTVGELSARIAVELGLAEERVERIRLAGLLHDIGKFGVPDEILRKPGKLTDAEYAEIKKHPELGARIIAGAGLEDIAEWVLAHHERPDGRGYPLGLPAREIPLEARILAVADSFEAMTADRVYREAMPDAEAIAELEACSGTQFDPGVVAAFLAARSN